MYTTSYVYIELAGILWLMAEAMILVIILAGARHVRLHPLPERLRIDKPERRILLCLLAILALIAIFSPGRHWYLESFPAAMERLSNQPGAPAADVEEAYRNAAATHLAVWSAFVLGWVLLEIAIVWNGIRLFHGVRRLIDEG